MTTKDEILALAAEPGTFQRENKYLVLKWGDVTNFLTDDQQLKLDALITKIRVGRRRQGKDDQSYVCIAADWPMYEQVWSMVEAFVDGKPNEIEQLQARITELEAHNAVLLDALDELVDLVQDIRAEEYKPDSFTCQPALAALASTPESSLTEIRKAERERVAQYVQQGTGDWMLGKKIAAAIRAME